MDVEHFEAPLIYPPGCEALTQNLATEELCGRLETLAYTFHTMGQDEGAYQELIPLALHLATDYFLMHPSEKVRLLIACCIADMLRVYAPEAPYKNPDQVKDIFMFLINQLAGLKDPKDPQFMRCVNLLEKLSREKLFNMLMGLDHCQGIFCNLVKMMFRIVNEKHSAKVKTYMLELMCPLITEYDKLSNEMLDTIAINIVEPNKSQLKSAYLLSKAIVVRCYEVFSKFVKKVLDKSQDTKDLAISVKVYELVYEMNQNCPTFLLDTIPQLELNLKSPDDEKRLGAVSFLAPMFSAPDSVWAISCRPLWQAFLSCCRDPSTVVCTKCVQGSPQILLNHPDLQQDVCRALFLCQRDTEEHVRFEVVMAIMATAEKEIQVVSTSPGLIQLLNILSSDKLGKVRRKAMSGLAMIYKNHLMMDANVPEATEKAVLWIRDKILHSYCLPDLDDKLMVEKLLKTCLVPSSLPTEDRMKKLYYLVGNVNEKAEIAFNALLKQQVSIRNLMSEILEIQKRPQEEAKDKEMDVKIEKLSQHLPEPIKAKKFLKEFLAHMAKDPSLLQVMVKLMNPEVNCKERSDCMSQALEKLELPVRNNVYYNTVKMLLERTSSVMVDHEAVKVLVGYVDACLRHSPLIKELGLQHCAAGWRGLILLKTLADVFTSHFLHEDVIRPLIKMLDLDDIHLQEYVPRLVLSILAVIGKCKPIGLMYPDIMVELTPKCQQWCVTGTPKALRQAIHCLFHNIPDGTETNTGARKRCIVLASCP